jgi:hypothetical protein
MNPLDFQSRCQIEEGGRGEARDIRIPAHVGGEPTRSPGIPGVCRDEIEGRFELSLEGRVLPRCAVDTTRQEPSCEAPSTGCTEANTAGRPGEFNVPSKRVIGFRLKNSPPAGRLFEPTHLLSRITRLQLGWAARQGQAEASSSMNTVADFQSTAMCFRNGAAYGQTDS